MIRLSIERHIIRLRLEHHNIWGENYTNSGRYNYKSCKDTLIIGSIKLILPKGYYKIVIKVLEDDCRHPLIHLEFNKDDQSS